MARDRHPLDDARPVRNRRGAEGEQDVPRARKKPQTEDDEDERPRRKPRSEDHEAERPRRQKKKAAGMSNWMLFGLMGGSIAWRLAWCCWSSSGPATDRPQEASAFP